MPSMFLQVQPLDDAASPPLPASEMVLVMATVVSKLIDEDARDNVTKFCALTPQQVAPDHVPVVGLDVHDELLTDIHCGHDVIESCSRQGQLVIARAAGAGAAFVCGAAEQQRARVRDADPSRPLLCIHALERCHRGKTAAAKAEHQHATRAGDRPRGP